VPGALESDAACNAHVCSTGTSILFAAFYSASEHVHNPVQCRRLRSSSPRVPACVTHMCEVVNPRQVLKSDVQLSVIPQGLQPNTIKRRSATGGQLMLMTGAGRRRMSTVDNAFAQCTGFSRCPPCLRLPHARAACGLWRKVSEQALHRISEPTTQGHTAAERYAAACLLESDH